MARNQKSIIVGELQALPGERTEGRIPVGEMQDGTSIELPTVLINGLADGKTIYLQAVSDGDELNGVAVIHEILRRVSPGVLRGNIIAIPVVNFHAFHAKQAYSPVDNLKMNRCFPGKADGTSSERIAYYLFNSVVKQADICIDLHQGGVKPMIDEVRVRVSHDHPLHKACFQLAKVFGIGYILDQKGPKGQLAQVAPDIGIPTIDPELGGCHGWNQLSISKGIRGILNVLKAYDFIDGEPEIPSEQFVAHQFASVVSNFGGFVHYQVTLADYVEAGQPIAEIHDVFGNLREVVYSPADGIFWSQPIYPMVSSGESIGKIGV